MIGTSMIMGGLLLMLVPFLEHIERVPMMIARSLRISFRATSKIPQDMQEKLDKLS